MRALLLGGGDSSAATGGNDRALGRYGGKGWAAAADGAANGAGSDDDEDASDREVSACEHMALLRLGSVIASAQLRRDQRCTQHLLTSWLLVRLQNTGRAQRDMDMEVVFQPGLDGLGERLLAGKRGKAALSSETVWDAYMRKRKCVQPVSP